MLEQLFPVIPGFRQLHSILISFLTLVAVIRVFG